MSAHTRSVSAAGLAQLPELDSLLHEFPGAAYRCLNDASWTMQYVSAGVRSLTGYFPEAFIGNRTLAFSDVIHAEDRQRVQDEIQGAVEARRGFALTYRIVTANGAIRFVAEHGNAIRDADGRVLALQGFVTDVTAAHQTQEALDTITNRFRHIAQATNDALWEWDLPTNALWWSHGIFTLAGWPPDAPALSLDCWTRLIHDDDRGKVMASISDALASPRRDWNAEYRLQRSDGSYAQVGVRAFILRDAGGAAIRMVGGLSDLTERRQSHAHLERLSRALRILSQCNEKLVHADDEQRFLADICQVLVATGGYRAAVVSLAMPDAELLSDVAPGTGPGVLTGTVTGYGADLHLLQQLTKPLYGALDVDARSASDGVAAPQNWIGIDVATEAALAPWRAGLLERGIRAAALVPVPGDNTLPGMLALYLDDSAPVDSEERTLLHTLADNIGFGIASIRSRAQRQRVETAAIKIAAGVSASTGTTFFTELACNMAQAVGADAAFVAEFTQANLQSATTIVAVVDEQVVPNFTYAIAGSPCEKIISSNHCIVLRDVTACFDTSSAARMGMQGYVGCRLDDAAGLPLGLLFVLFRGNVVQPDFVRQTIQIFAVRAEAELERLRADLRIREQASLLDKAKDAIVVHDAQDRATFWNKGAERLYGLTAAQVLGEPVSAILYGDPPCCTAVYDSLARDGEWQGEVLHRRADGSTLVVDVSSAMVRNAAGQPSTVLSIVTDITRRKAAEQEVTYLAFRDRVTDLPNRHALMKQLDALLGADRPMNGQGALLWIDLDRLKDLNDSCGHEVGDLLLRQTGKRIMETIGDDALAARFGGDEFVVLIAGPAGEPARANATAQQLLRRLSEPFDLEGQAHVGSASIGLTFFQSGRDTAAEILKRADIAMYEAKAAGRNALRLFDADMQRRVELRTVLENDLRSALAANELHLVYQPQVAQDGSVVGVEALMRWQHPTRGPISPVEFIPLAETSGLIVSFGEWILRQACLQLQRWERHPQTRKLTIAVNVSALQIRHHGFIDQVTEILRSTGIDPRKLKLELTESTLVTDTESTVARMTALKAAGIRFSLDDFGTGFSSLSYLKRLPLDQLKIDRSFVCDVIKDPNAAAIVRTVITLGQSLGLDVIAEGVETEAQRDFLALHGCTVYQGYFFSRPLTLDALDVFLTQHSGP